MPFPFRLISVEAGGSPGPSLQGSEELEQSSAAQGKGGRALQTTAPGVLIPVIRLSASVTESETPVVKEKCE